MKTKITLLVLLPFLILGFTTLMHAQTSSLTNGLVAHYKLDEATGDVVDSSGNSYHGTNNGATRGIAGKTDNCFDFDGINDYVSIPHNANLNPNLADYSISVWFKFEGGTIGYNIYTLFSKGVYNINGNEVYISLRANGVNGIVFRVRDNSGNLCQALPSTDLAPVIEDGNWHNITGVIDEDAPNEIQLYFDGNLVGTAATNTVNVTNTTNLEIGRYNGIYKFNGLIDDVRFWNRALSANEIAFLYNEGTTSELLGGTISTAVTTVNSGESPGTIQSDAPAGGGDGTYNYQWQESADNTTWTAIDGATGETYPVPELTQTTWFRREVSSSGITACSNAVMVEVSGTGDSGLWTAVDNNIYNTNTGNVGIGTTTPVEKLHVNGNINIAADSAYQIGGENVLRMQSQNLFIGKAAGAETTEGETNLFVGYESGKSNTTGDNNLFVGCESGSSNTTGDNNLFIGSKSGKYNTTGYTNFFIGCESGRFNSTGYNNVFLGYRSGQQNTGGNHNLFMGSYSGTSNSTGIQNSFVGYQSGQSNTEGSANLFIGNQSGYSNTTGDGNVFLGYQAGYNETGSNKLYIENSSSSTPLIYGEFDNDIVTINGTLTATSFVGDGSQLSGIPSASGGVLEVVAYILFSDNGGGITVHDSHNLSVQHVANGTYQLNFTTSMPDNNYLVTGMCNYEGSAAQSMGLSYSRTTSEFNVTCWHGIDGQRRSGNYASVIVYHADYAETASATPHKSTRIEKLENEVAALKQMLTSNPTQSINKHVLEENSAKLYQNTPNPFNNQTEIRYFLPDNTETATLLVFDMNGKQLKSYELTQRGSGNVVIYGNDLRAGMYLYALMANNKLVDTKRMVLTE